MKYYLKYNFQYLIIAGLSIGHAIRHLMTTGRLSCIIGGFVLAAFSIAWSIFRPRT